MKSQRNRIGITTIDKMISHQYLNDLTSVSQHHKDITAISHGPHNDITTISKQCNINIKTNSHQCRNVPRDVPWDVPRDVRPRDVPRDVPWDVPRDVPRDVPLRNYAEDAPKFFTGKTRRKIALFFRMNK